MNRGYVHFWRKSIDSPIFAHEGLWKLWCLCLMKASHRKHTFMVGATPITLLPGQFVTGRYALWEDYHQWHLIKRKPRRKPAPSAITVHRWLLTLQNMQMLHIKSTNKYSIITICNWDQYQQNEQQMNNKRTTDDHKQEVYIYKSSFYQVRKDEYLTYEKAYPGIDIMAEFEKMNAWLVSNPKKRKKDYPKFINNWLNSNHQRMQKENSEGYSLEDDFEPI